MSEFHNLCAKIGFETTDFNFQINEYHNKFKTNQDDFDYHGDNFDCKIGRVLTESGVYVCPFLANDHRGRMGADFSDFSKKMFLETDFCLTCIKNQGKMFSLNLDF